MTNAPGADLLNLRAKISYMQLDNLLGGVSCFIVSKVFSLFCPANVHHCAFFGFLRARSGTSGPRNTRTRIEAEGKPLSPGLPHRARPALTVPQ